MYEQLSIFDWMPTAQKEPDVGEWVTEHGASIPHIMRPSYIGKKVVMDKSTTSHKWFKVGILERYFQHEGTWRAIIYDGSKQRNCVAFFRDGIGIYECLPWDAYEKRNEAIGRKA